MCGGRGYMENLCTFLSICCELKLLLKYTHTPTHTHTHIKLSRNDTFLKGWGYRNTGDKARFKRIYTFKWKEYEPNMNQNKTVH